MRAMTLRRYFGAMATGGFLFDVMSCIGQQGKRRF